MPIEEPIPYETLKPIVKGLEEVLPKPILFEARSEIENLTDEQAWEVMRAVRRALLMQLLHQEYHEHMLDDCGDYLEAASFNWNHIWNEFFMNDGEGFTERVKKWLLNETGEGLLGSDGEIRFDLIAEPLLEDIYYKEA